MFRGVTTLNLDAKGRIAIPTRYRERLQSCCASQLVITVDKDECLLLYPEPEWVEIERKLRNLPSFNPVARAYQRLYIGHAQDVEMDGQGRILLSAELRKYANLNKRVALVGQVNKFELWDEEAWSAKRGDWKDLVGAGEGELPADLESFSL